MNLFIWLGSLPPLDTVFTYYAENASPLSVSSVQNLMKTESKEHLR